MAGIPGLGIDDVLRQFGSVVEMALPGLLRRRLAPTGRDLIEQGPRGVFPAPGPAAPIKPSGRYSLGGSGSTTTRRVAQPAPTASPAPAPRAPRPEPAVTPVFKPPATSPLSATSPGTYRMSAVEGPALPPTPPAAPSDARQLDMSSGFSRLTYPKGTTTAEGINVGGLTYNPADVMPEGAYTQRIRELANKLGIDPELALQQMRSPGRSLADEVDFTKIPQGTGFFAPPSNNLLRSATTNLTELIKKNPVLAATALGAGSIGVGAGANLLYSQFADQQRNRGAGQINVDPTGTASVLGETSSNLTPPEALNLPAPDYRDPVSQTVITTPGDGGREALNAAKQQYVSRANTPARQLEDYYRQREVYAKIPTVSSKITEQLTTRGALQTPELKAWAEANPTLAYELLRKKFGVSDVMNQQMPQIKQYELGSALGTNNVNNAIGNAQSTAEAALGQQGASDVASAAAPMMYEKLEAFRFNPAAAEALGSVNAYRPESSQIDADAYARLAEFYRKQPSQYRNSSTGY